MSHTVAQINSSTSLPPQPLTTVFAPPPDCFEWSSRSSTSYTTSSSGTTAIVVVVTSRQDPILLLTCFPPSYLWLGQAASAFGRSSGLAHTYYSPGVCPDSYVYAATAVNSPGGGAAATTTAICCPSGVDTAPVSSSGTGAWCTRTTSTPHNVSPSSFKEFSESTMVPVTLPVETLTVLQANPIYVAWQESDLLYFTPASAPVLALQRAGATFISIATSTASITAQSNPVGGIVSYKTLSTGAEAGMGVAVAMGGLVIIAVSLWLFIFLRRARRRNLRQVGAYESADKPELDSKPKLVAEVSSDGQVHEFDGPHGRSELHYKFARRSERAELDAGFLGHEVGGGAKSPI